MGKEEPTAAELADLLAKPLLTPPEVAKVLRISRSKAYAQMAGGYLPAFRVGEKSLRIAGPALQQWISDQQPAGQQGVNSAPSIARRGYNRRDRT